MAISDMGNGVKCRMQQNRFQITTPYNESFVVFAHTHGGRWKKRSGFWSFPRREFPYVARKCNELFGTKFQVRVGGE